MARLFLLVGIAIAPATGLLIYNDHADRQRREAEAHDLVLRYARLISGDLDRLFEGTRAMLTAAAQAPPIQAFENPACTDYLTRLGSSVPSTTAVSVFDRSGRLVCGNLGALNVADRPYFKQALAGEDFVVGEHTLGRVSRIPLLPFAMRVTSPSGEVLGVISTNLRLDWLGRHLQDRAAAFPPRTSLTVVDREGTILVRLPNREREGTRLTQYPQILTAGSDGTFRSEASRTADGVARFLGHTAIDSAPRGIAVAVGLPEATVLAGVREAATRNAILLALSAALALAAAWVVGRAAILRPIRDLVATTERWRRGDLAARADERGGSELARLGAAFNAMAADLEATLRHKDVMLRELSHRVMNSLQTLSALVRLQARASSDGEARRQAHETVTRIDSMALAYRRLHAADGIETVDFGAFLRELCRDLEGSMTGADNPLVVEADPIVLAPDQAMPLALVVNELVTNAIKHGTREPGPITVKLGRSSEGCRLAVRNRGVLPPGYDPAGASGFGMRMIASTVAQLGGRLEASSMGGETEFGVTFRPKAPQPTVLSLVQGGAEARSFA